MSLHSPRPLAQCPSPPSPYRPRYPPKSPRPVDRLRRFVSAPNYHDLHYWPDYPLPDPNLELHSAAASGNVGLVHYALTHGQPVNSVLHGVLPLHAACSGGSLSVVKMLIDRGADVNAPRLPRRYSDGKKSTAPSIGAAGSTPLHFAAANGHAAIAQILLTCGAIPNKEDKNGMTPEALAEINGHTDVIRVLRVWEHLAANDPEYQASIAPSYAPSENGPSSPADSYVVDDVEGRFASVGSRKGKDRASSFASNVSSSTTGNAVKLRHSLEGLFKGRSSRSGSVVSSRPSIHRPDALSMTQSAVADDDTPPAEPSPRSPDSAIHSPASHSLDLDRVKSTASGSSSIPPVVRVTSEDQDEDREADGPDEADEADEVIALSPSSSNNLGPAPSRHNPSTSGSSRRPSLPSILERAAHPGAAFRAALRRDHHKPTPLQTDLPPSDSAISPTTGPSPITAGSNASSGSSHGFFRGRLRSNDHPRQPKTKNLHRYNAKHAITHLFRRGHSPPSRSPSPPRRSEPTKPIEPGQIEEGIEKMRRASLDLDMRENGTLGEDAPPRMPVSAPPTKTTFFTDSIATPIPPPNPAFIPLPPTPPIGTPRERSATISSDRPRRPRQASEVIAPSPLSNEWAGSSDSDTPSSFGIRRSKTEYARPPSETSSVSTIRSALQGYRTNPPSPLRLPTSPRHRAVTSPSTPVGGSNLRSTSGTKLTGLGWSEPIDLRKVASLKQGTITHLEEVARKSGEYDDDREQLMEPEELHGTGDEETETEERGTQDPASRDAQGVVVDDEVEPTASPMELSSSKLSDETERGNDEAEVESKKPTTPPSGVEVAVTEPSPVDAVEAAKSSQSGRYRGASIGSTSGTTESSRIATPPWSSTRMSFVQSDDDRSLLYNISAYVGVDPKNMPPPPPPPSSVGGRSRGKSVSSTSSIPSDMSLSYFQPSTPSTSLTPQSTLSIPLGRFAPVPEHEEAHHPGQQRKISNREEAREAKKQAEEDVLQLAQLPPSLGSSRSLAAQLAAYGETHAIEAEFAARESRRKQSAGTGATSGDGESESEAWFSARSDAESRGSSAEGSSVSKAKTRRKGVAPMSSIPAELLPAKAQRSSLKSINAVYDRRAAAYRDRMAALTALPPNFPSSLSSTSGRTSRLRAPSNESWLMAGSSGRRPGLASESDLDTHPHISSLSQVRSIESLPRAKQRAGSLGTSLRQTTSRSSAMHGGGSSATPSLAPTRKTSGGTRSKAPAPIADVISTRYAGMSPPPNVPQPPRLDPASPYISIFSNRYAGAPHDGDESDDDEHPQTNLTVVENDWRGARLLQEEAFERKGRWGQIKGAMGRKGRKAS